MEALSCRRWRHINCHLFKQFFGSLPVCLADDIKQALRLIRQPTHTPWGQGAGQTRGNASWFLGFFFRAITEPRLWYRKCFSGRGWAGAVVGVERRQRAKMFVNDMEGRHFWPQPSVKRAKGDKLAKRAGKEGGQRGNEASPKVRPRWRPSTSQDISGAQIAENCLISAKKTKTAREDIQ